MGDTPSSPDFVIPSDLTGLSAASSIAATDVLLVVADGVYKKVTRDVLFGSAFRVASLSELPENLVNLDTSEQSFSGLSVPSSLFGVAGSSFLLRVLLGSISGTSSASAVMRLRLGGILIFEQIAVNIPDGLTRTAIYVLGVRVFAGGLIACGGPASLIPGQGSLNTVPQPVDVSALSGNVDLTLSYQWNLADSTETYTLFDFELTR